MKTFKGTTGSMSVLVLYVQVIMLTFQLSVDVIKASDVCETFDYTVYGDIDKVFPNCSGHGECVNEREVPCKCEDGWTGLSDLINTDGIDCQINEYAVKSLWAFLLLLCFWGQYKGLGSFLHRLRQYKRTRNELMARGKEYPIRKQRVLLACFSFQFICFPFTVIIAILRIAKDDERVGVTFGMTLLFGLAKIGFYLANYYYNPSLLHMTLKDGKNYLNGAKVKTLERAVKVFHKVVMVTSITLGFLPFITYGNGGVLDDTARAVYVTYFVGMVITISSMGLQSYILKQRVEDMLDKSYNVSQDERILIIKNKLITLQTAGIKQSFMQVTFYLTFLFNPYQWNLHDYFLPISWISFVILGKNMMVSVVRDGEGQSSSKLATSKGPGQAGNSSYNIYNSKGIHDDDKEVSYTMTSFHKQNSVKESSKGESEASDV